MQQPFLSSLSEVAIYQLLTRHKYKCLPAQLKKVKEKSGIKKTAKIQL